MKKKVVMLLTTVATCAALMMACGNTEAEAPVAEPAVEEEAEVQDDTAADVEVPAEDAADVEAPVEDAAAEVTDETTDTEDAANTEDAADAEDAVSQDAPWGAAGYLIYREKSPLSGIIHLNFILIRKHQFMHHLISEILHVRKCLPVVFFRQPMIPGDNLLRHILIDFR